MGMNQERSLKSVVDAVWCGTALPRVKRNIGKRIKRNAKDIVEGARNEEEEGSLMVKSVWQAARHSTTHMCVLSISLRVV